MVIRLVALMLCLAAPLRAEPLDAAGTTVELLRLRAAFDATVRNPIHPDAARTDRWAALARTALADAAPDHDQLVVVVDRNPRVQQLLVMLASPTDPWRAVGGSTISTGQTGRFDHYLTPTGVFHVSDAILGYRAEGTLNENGIRGLGAKGMRVWDFGWQTALKGWAEPAGKPDRTPIRFMLHATDPDHLERRLGHPASQGCIRMPAGLDRFLDEHGVIDASYERAAATDIRFRALLLAGRTPTTLAGNTLIVIDSSPAQAFKPPPDPQHPAAPIRS